MNKKIIFTLLNWPCRWMQTYFFILFLIYFFLSTIPLSGSQEGWVSLSELHMGEGRVLSPAHCRFLWEHLGVWYLDQNWRTKDSCCYFPNVSYTSLNVAGGLYPQCGGYGVLLISTLSGNSNTYRRLSDTNPAASLLDRTGVEKNAKCWLNICSHITGITTWLVSEAIKNITHYM